MYSKEHSQIVLETITGKRPADEKTFASASILYERLENLKKLHRAFLDVEFSPFAQPLLRQESELAVG